MDEQAPNKDDPTSRGRVPDQIPVADRKRLFDAESERLPASPLVKLLRWWIPGALCLLGVVLLVIEGFTTTGVDAFAAFAGAGSSIWLINFLWRLGITGDEERDVEAEDRVYLQKHGHWPDDDQTER